jgi:DtxR family Mn-dependent transcriptional regulator
MSGRVLAALERYLDNPDVCPHGHPIPTAAGIVDAADGRSLADAQAGESLTVLRVAEKENVLGYLGERGLRPGATFSVSDRDAVGQLLTLDIDGRREVLSFDIARHVTVIDR